MDYLEALAHLDALINNEATPRAGAIEGLTLDPMRELMSVLGDPQHAYPAIHITGTNGKGSTGRMIETILTAMGLRVGLYTSPHLHTPRERIRVAGEVLDEEEFGLVIGDIARVVEVQGLGPLTWFETVTAAGFLHFANEAVDIAVIEVGLLGRFDATNVVSSQVAVITNVGLDHTDGSAGWHRRVAEEKAGIIEPGTTVVVGDADDELLEIIAVESPATVIASGRDYEVVADEVAVGGRLVSLRTPRSTHDDLFLGLHGAHQALNAATAVATVEEFFDAGVNEDVLTEAFRTVEAPGRLEVVHRAPTVLLDAAHNSAGAEALAMAVEEDFGGGTRRYLVIGMQDGRDPRGVLDALDAASYELVVTCTAPSARGVRSEDLCAVATSLGAKAEAMTDVAGAVDRVFNLAAEDDLIVVAGSITVIAVAREMADDL